MFDGSVELKGQMKEPMSDIYKHPDKELKINFLANYTELSTINLEFANEEIDIVLTLDYKKLEEPARDDDSKLKKKKK